LRDNGVSGSMSFRKVGRIQSPANPIIFNLSDPLSHLMPVFSGKDEARTTDIDL